MQPYRPPLNIAFRIKLNILNLYKIVLRRISQDFHLPYILFFFQTLSVSIYWVTIMNLSKRKQRWIKHDFYPWIRLSFIRLTRLGVALQLNVTYFTNVDTENLNDLQWSNKIVSDKTCPESWQMFQYLLWSRNFKTPTWCYLFFPKKESQHPSCATWHYNNS